MEQLTSEQIVAIAKDVILQIETRRIIATAGYYFLDEETRMSNSIIRREDGTLDLQEYMLKETKPCLVCARGALVLSKAKLYNDCVVGPTRSIQSLIVEESGFGRVFGRVGVEAESAFESGYGYEDDDGENITTWKDTYPEDEDRLVAIMENIIRNGGDFNIDEIEPPPVAA